MKKLSFIFAMVLLVGFAMAQNYNTINIGGSGNTATIDQIGDLNSNDLIQSSNNIFELTQTGNENYSKFRQAAPGSNEGYVIQTGFKNQLTGNLQGNNNWMKLDQLGDLNVANVYQDTKDQKATILQQGISNYAKVSQDSPNNEATINEVGSYNQASVVQDNLVAGTTAKNLASIDMLGSHNGDGTNGDAMITMEQKGENNYAYLTLKGDYNDADVYQTNNGNVSFRTITGDNNNANLTQTGGDASTENIIGNYNVVTVNQ